MEASCPCGSCKFQVQGDPAAVMRCHCADCRDAISKDYYHTAIYPADKVTTLKEDVEPRQASRPVLVRNYCRSCKAHVCNNLSNEDGKLQRRAIPVEAFKRASPDNSVPWPTSADIWYSERVVDMMDDIPKWSGWPKASERMDP